ncbi:MAG: preprotein translocase subunit YajC [Isosphaeraceae bacterium]
MSGLIETTPALLAQAAGAGGNQGFSSYLIFIYMGIALLWFYLFLIRPPQQQEKKRQAMLNALKKNDRVLTAAGIYGTVVSIDDKQDRVSVRIDDDKGGKVVFTRASIVRILDGKEGADKAGEVA